MFNYYSILVVLFALAGFALIAFSLRRLSSQRNSKNWQSCQAKITRNSASDTNHDGLPVAMFQYELAGNVYDGVLIAPSQQATLPEYVSQFLREHEPGDVVNVFVNPNNPIQYAFSNKTKTEDWLVLVLGVAAMLFGAGLFIVNI